MVEEARKTNPNIQIIPRFQCEGFSGDTLGMMISEANRDKLIKGLIKRLQFSKLDGMNLECTAFWLSEDLYPLYVVFLSNLYKQLHEKNKKLILTFLPASASIPQVVNKIRFDYVNRFSDYSVLMTYDYIHFNQKDSPREFTLKNSPEPWVKETISWYTDAKTLEKLGTKILIGTSFHGFILDRKETTQLKGSVISNQELTRMLADKSSDFTLKWNKIDKEYSFGIESEKTSYVACIPTARSIKSRVELVNSLNVGGISIWEIGQGYSAWMDEL